MLIIFHYLGFFIYQLMKNRKRLKLGHQDESVIEREFENTVKFDPPVYRQRYGKVYEILIKEKWRKNLKKLVDFGCAEFGLFIFLKDLNLNEIMFVDINENLLDENICRVQPLLGDHLKRRYSPLEVTVFKGSVSDPDYRLHKTDVVTAIELIEHLYPDTLDAFCYNIFSYIQAKLIIITTPNADFNVVFKKVNMFRHPDHKFEWTRNQFKDWCQNITERFQDYRVEINGIGEYFEETKMFGCCSQMALFIRKDVEDEKYISKVYTKPCCCDTHITRKEHTPELKLSCKCVCPLCVPDYSVGICKYNSLSELSSSTINIIKERDNVDINMIYNIFYKCLFKVEYPVEVDSRSEEERLLDILKYRIYVFSTVSSRFYVDETQRCEIPIIDIMYGNINMEKEGVRKLLEQFEYKLEPCIIPGTNISEDCIITLPHEMEDISSSSDVTDDYSSKSDTNEDIKFDGTLESESDWDDTNSVKVKKIETQGSTVASSKPKPDPLFDSGYLNSPSPLEPTLMLPQEPLDADQTEEKPNSLNKDNKGKRKSVQKDKFAVSPTCESNKEPSVAGPSGWKRNVKQKDMNKKPNDVSTPNEPTHLEDAKSITNCIIQNSLNKIEVDEEIRQFKSELIKDLSPQENIIEVPEEVHEQRVERQQEVPVLMENSDVANNNRDNEGNNFPAHDLQDVEIDEGIGVDLLNDNLEDLALFLEDNLHMPNNNNVPPVPAPVDAAVDVIIDRVIPNEPQPEPEDDRQLVEDDLAHASHEALYDVNSEPDMLDDFDIPPQTDELVWRPVDADVVFMGFQSCTSQNVVDLQNGPVSVETNTNNFPQWLLQIFSSQVNPEDGSVPNQPETRDEPHFYCQGDGLGVHPSIVAVDVDEAEDADDSSEETSSNDTRDFAEVDPGPSETFDMSSLPEESCSAVDDGNNSNARNNSSIIWGESSSDNDRCNAIARDLMDQIVDAAENEVGRISTTLDYSQSFALEASGRTYNEDFSSISSTFSEEARTPRLTAESDHSSQPATQESSNVSRSSSELIYDH
ncbi:hen1 methyltransferase isoform X2 [Rhynchophorus ferrugineus]|uniref:hen1 methyltransferase isoform X2 n=1 Tax=Rhynchophorus ferrugineus TaxID=354439 RepID=UPI003FCCE8DE